MRTKGSYARILKTKERNRAKNLAGEVSRALLDISAEHQCAVVLEDLTSALSTRGGKGTAMSFMQYKNMFTAMEEKLAQVGCYKKPYKDDGDRFNGNYFFRIVNAANTSQTCSECGLVHDSSFYRELALSLKPTGKTGTVTLPNGKTKKLPKTYLVRTQSQGEKTVDTAQRLEKILKGDEVKELPKTRFKQLLSLVRNKGVFSYRPDQKDFICQSCGHKDDADTQAAVNIARKQLWLQSKGKKKKPAPWPQWYQNRAAKGWK
jgi:hypothetical protein